MMFTKHHPNGTGGEHLDNSKLEECIFHYQQGDSGALSTIVELVQPRITALVRFHRTDQYRSEDELRSDANFKLMRSIGRFDARRASGFSFVSRIIETSLRTAVSNQRRHWQRYGELSSEIENTLPARSDNWERADDLIHKIRARTRTTLTNETELNACRWYIESFCQEGFASRRHACADAAMGVFQLTHARSRELHDLCMLETRRILFDVLPPRQPIIAGRLLGTRSGWMARYVPLLSESEFTRFYTLMLGLAPYLLLLILDAGKNGSHRRDRCPTVSRRNLELILNGDPAGVLLFE
jgi:hypothetical protein